MNYKILLTNQPIHNYYYLYFYVKMTCFGASSGIFSIESEARSTDVVSYLRYDYRLRHVLWISHIVHAMHVVQSLFYRTYDMLSWIATLLTWDRVINPKMTNRLRLKSRLTPFNRMWQNRLLTRYTQTNRLDQYFTEWLLPTWDTSAPLDEKIPDSTLLFANHLTPMTWREMSVLTDWLSSRFVLDGLWLLTTWIGLFWLVYLLYSIPATDDKTFL